MFTGSLFLGRRLSTVMANMGEPISLKNQRRQEPERAAVGRAHARAARRGAVGGEKVSNLTVAKAVEMLEAAGGV
jgi:hypothetical protein